MLCTLLVSLSRSDLEADLRPVDDGLQSLSEAEFAWRREKDLDERSVPALYWFDWPGSVHRADRQRGQVEMILALWVFRAC